MLFYLFIELLRQFYVGQRFRLGLWSYLNFDKCDSRGKPRVETT